MKNISKILFCLSLLGAAPSLVSMETSAPLIYRYEFIEDLPYKAIKVIYQDSEVGRIKYQIKPDGNLEIHTLFVFSRHRGKGIGSILLREAKEHLWSLYGDDKDIYFYAMTTTRDVTMEELINYYQNRGAILVKFTGIAFQMKFPAPKPKPTLWQKHKNIIKSISIGMMGLTAYATWQWLQAKRG